MIKKDENNLPSTYVINGRNGEQFSYEKKNAKQIKKDLELKSNKKCKKLYVKCKGYDNSFNCWIDKKDIV